MAITTGTPAVGPSSQTAAAPDAAVKVKAYASAYAASGNALVVGDLLTGLINRPVINRVAATSQVAMADGTVIANIGETTAEAFDLDLKGPTSDAHVNLFYLKTDDALTGLARAVNFNLADWDTSIIKCFCYVLGVTPLRGEDNDVPGFRFRLQPFGFDDAILATA